MWVCFVYWFFSNLLKPNILLSTKSFRRSNCMELDRLRVLILVSIVKFWQGRNQHSNHKKMILITFRWHRVLWIDWFWAIFEPYLSHISGEKPCWCLRFMTRSSSA
jgi:hypothetical protein